MGRIDRAVLDLTSCARGDTICLRPCKLTISSYLFARWHLFQHIGCLRHQQHVDLQPFDLGSGVRVTCDVGYLCANFSIPCSRVRPNVRDRHTDRQTDVRQKHRLMPPPCGGGGITTFRILLVEETPTLGGRLTDAPPSPRVCYLFRCLLFDVGWYLTVHSTTDPADILRRCLSPVVLHAPRVIYWMYIYSALAVRSFDCCS